MKSLKFIAAAAIACFSLQSQAALLELDGAGSYEPMASTNDFFYGEAAGYDIGGNLYATEDIHLMFTYLGHEAGYNNDFTAYGETLNNKSNSVGDSFYVHEVAQGLIDFNFFANSINQGISNGSNNDFGAYQSFATILNYTYNGVFYDAIILFDDSGAGPDDNHDDHIIGIQASVPEPGTFALFAIGLICLVFSRRRIMK